MIKEKIYALLSILLICLFVGCGTSDVSKGLETYAASYLEKFKNGDYEGMYDMLDTEAKDKFPREPFLSWNRDIIERSGRIESYKKLSTRKQPSKEGKEISISYDVFFTEGKSTFTILILEKQNRFSVLYMTISLLE